MKLSLIHLNLAVILLLSIQKRVHSYTVNCDARGACWLQMSNNESFYLNIGRVPLQIEKNIVPLKNITSNTDNSWKTNQKVLGYSLLGLLTRSVKYECTGGLNECVNGCCNKGLCSDPLNVCVAYSNNIRLIDLIVGFIFLLFFIVYWTLFYVFGIIYNAKPKVSKADNIYSRFAQPKQENETEKIITPNNFGSTDKFEENKNLIGEENAQKVEYKQVLNENNEEEIQANPKPQIEMNHLNKNLNNFEIEKDVKPKSIITIPEENSKLSNGTQQNQNPKDTEVKIDVNGKTEEPKKKNFNWMFN